MRKTGATVVMCLLAFATLAGCDSVERRAQMAAPLVPTDLRRSIQQAQSFSDIFVRRRVVQLSSEPGCLLASCNEILWAGGKVVAVDSRVARRVLAFDAKTGMFVAAIGQHGNGPGEYAAPDWVAIDSAGHVVVLDANSARLFRYTMDGKLVSRLDLASKRLFATRVEVGPDGLFYLFLTHAAPSQSGPNGMIVAIDTTGRRVRSFVPVPDLARRIFYVAGGFVIARDGKIWVARPFEPVIEIWTTSGTFVGRVDKHLADLPSPFRRELIEKSSLKEALRVLSVHTTANGIFLLEPGLIIMASSSSRGYCLTFVDAGSGEVVRGALCFTPETAGALTSPILGAYGSTVLLVQPPSGEARSNSGGVANLAIAFFGFKVLN